MAQRALRLVAGCVLLGSGTALMVLAHLGLSPWDVLHQGVSKHTGIPIGTVGIIVGLVALVGWAPLKVRVRVGTATNVVLVGSSIDVVLALASEPRTPVVRAACLAAGIVLMGLGTALYIGAGLGTGPRDGLMTGLAVRTHRSIRLVRTGIELAALVIGTILGGSVGVGTLLFTVAIGPLIQLFLGYLTVPVPVLTTPAE